MTPFLGLLDVVDRLKAKDAAVRTYYDDIRAVGSILFAEGQTKKQAKRQLLEIKTKWVAQIRRLEGSRDPKPASVLQEWCNLTGTYWPGLFHCYSNPHIPGTNNSTEQKIKDLKTDERVLSRNPNPAVRFLRHAATAALFLERHGELPGPELIASLTSEEMATLKAQLRKSSSRWAVKRRARADRTKLLNEVHERWKRAAHPPDYPTSSHATTSAGS